MRIAVLYNTDYDEELKDASGADVSAVEASAHAVSSGIKDAGHDVSLVGVHGDDYAEVLEKLKTFDAVFNVCESLRGDARNEIVFPALMDLFGIPYTGASSFALDLCLHKDRCKAFLRGQGLNVPDGFTFDGEAPAGGVELPAFLKLAHEDASVGIDERNVVNTWEELETRATQLHQKYKQAVIVESFIQGREINATLLQVNGRWQVLPLHEIDFADMTEGRPHIVSYLAKWDEAHEDYIGTKPVPVKALDQEIEERLMKSAIAAAELCGLRDYCRVDFRIDQEGVPWIIDVNPNCDISPDAGFVRSAKVGGYSYSSLMDCIANSAKGRSR